MSRTEILQCNIKRMRKIECGKNIRKAQKIECKEMNIKRVQKIECEEMNIRTRKIESINLDIQNKIYGMENG